MTLPTVQLTDADHGPFNTVYRPIGRVIDQSYLSWAYAGKYPQKREVSLMCIQVGSMGTAGTRKAS